jgi:predicted nucleic acid-binding protein
LVAAAAESATCGERSRDDLEPVVELLAEPHLVSYRDAVEVVGEAGLLPVDAFRAAVARAAADPTLDQAIVATCAKTLDEVAAGTFVEALRAEECQANEDRLLG